MRYASILGAFVLLIATPIFAQEMSPIVVNTGKPVPSVVRTGEPFTVTYRAQYTDAVLIFEEQMELKNLSLLQKDEKTGEMVTAGDAEVINLVIGEKQRNGNEDSGYINFQDFTYTFRIIGDKKGVYSLSSFDFIWVKKKAGVTVVKAKEVEELKKLPTEEVGVSYVTSIVKPPPLDIRDAIEFESPGWLSSRLQKTAYGIIGFSSLLALVVLVRFVRQPKSRKSDKQAEDQKAGVYPIDEAAPVISPKQARKKFLKELGKLSKNQELMNDPLGLEKELRKLIRAFLVTEMSEGPVRVYESDTDNEIFVRLAHLSGEQVRHDWSRYGLVKYLAMSAKAYQEDIDSGQATAISEPQVEIEAMAQLFKELTWRGRLMLRLRRRSQ